MTDEHHSAGQDQTREPAPIRVPWLFAVCAIAAFGFLGAAVILLARL